MYTCNLVHDDTCLQELLRPSPKSYVVHFLGMEQVPKSEGVDAVRGPIRVRSVCAWQAFATCMLFAFGWHIHVLYQYIVLG